MYSAELSHWTPSDWITLVPDLTIGASDSIVEIVFPEKDLETIADQFWARGYLALPPVLTRSRVQQLAEAATVLQAHDLPPVCLFLFDQPWQLFAELNGLLRHFLGASFAVLPNLWAWHLNRPGQAGWPMHRDCDAETVFKVGEDELLMSLSLWIPLTDTNEANGCMHVVPRPLSNLLENASDDPRTYLAKKSQPLPAAAGAVLGWAQDIYHWGGEFTQRAAGPRISLSLEFQNMSFDPLDEPLIMLSDLPDFDQRRTLIMGQFAKYRHMEAAPAR